MHLVREEVILSKPNGIITKARSRPNSLRDIPPPEPDVIDDLTETFRMLADRSRLKIIMALARDDELHVSALTELLGQSQPAVSHHLTLMRAVGLVGFRRNGKHNFYYLKSEHLRNLIDHFFTDTGHGKQLHFEDFVLSFKRK